MIKSKEKEIEYYKIKLEATLKYFGVLSTTFLTFGILSFSYLTYLEGKSLNSILPGVSLLIMIGIILIAVLFFTTKNYISILNKLKKLYENY